MFNYIKLKKMAAKKKLKLDKKTVTKLSAEELRNIEGGIITSCSPINNCCGGGDDNGGITKGIIISF